MKKAVFAFVVVALCGSMAFAENDMGMTFTFNGLSNLGVNTINNGTIGLKKAMGPDQWLLVRVGGGFGKDTGQAGDPANSDPEETDILLNAAVGIQKNMAETDRVVPYIGGMVGFDWMQNKVTPELPSSPANNTLLETKMTELGFGAWGMLGFEYFVRESVSLGGDYTFGFMYNKDKTSTDWQGAGTIDSESSGFDLGPFGAVNAVINVYFGMDS